MKLNLKLLSIWFVCITLGLPAIAQPVLNESGSEVESENGVEADTPRDDVYDRHLMEEKIVLSYDHLREADVFWEKRIWRVIDVREKMNKPFVYPELPFINILLESSMSGEITLYSTIDDKFTSPLTVDEVSSIGTSVDTIITFDPDTYEEKIKVVRNDLNWEDIKRFRVKEVWFFDEETSMMQVRILGIAPLKEEFDDNGNFKFEYPMFWAYYPDCREILARNYAFNPMNDAQRMSWEDMLEMRYFASYIMKESNVYDRRIQDYKSGIDILFEAEKVKEGIFNFEHDLWTF